MHERSFRGSTSLLLVGLLTGCSGSKSPSPTPPGPTEEQRAAPSAPDTWKDALSMDDKMGFMQAHVVSKMGDLFKGANPEHYANFGCQTCHGPDNQDPKDFLSPLQMKDGQFAAAQSQPEVVQFMMQQVVPEMAALLGEPAYDPTTHTGFGCGGCHTIEMN
ncbi:MAG: hypothetical protein JKY37_10275 [Nannocystaceae bacterium]|nr:hypothetical protein [Nannocystaceae bacterium]